MGKPGAGASSTKAVVAGAEVGSVGAAPSAEEATVEAGRRRRQLRRRRRRRERWRKRRKRRRRERSRRKGGRRREGGGGRGGGGSGGRGGGGGSGGAAAAESPQQPKTRRLRRRSRRKRRDRRLPRPRWRESHALCWLNGESGRLVTGPGPAIPLRRPSPPAAAAAGSASSELELGDHPLRRSSIGMLGYRLDSIFSSRTSAYSCRCSRVDSPASTRSIIVTLGNVSSLICSSSLSRSLCRSSDPSMKSSILVSLVPTTSVKRHL